MSGRPGSNRPPEAWKATALPNELLPLIKFWRFEDLVISQSQKTSITKNISFSNHQIDVSSNWFCGQSRVRTYVLVREQIYSLPPLTTRPSAHFFRWQINRLTSWKENHVNLSTFKLINFAPEPKTGVEPATYWLQISCSTNWATSAYLLKELFKIQGIKQHPYFFGRQR